jgi:hypothetical protein
LVEAKGLVEEQESSLLAKPVNGFLREFDLNFAGAFKLECVPSKKEIEASEAAEAAEKDSSGSFSSSWKPLAIAASAAGIAASGVLDEALGGFN